MWQDESISFPQINLTKDKQSSKLLVTLMFTHSRKGWIHCDAFKKWDGAQQ